MSCCTSDWSPVLSRSGEAVTAKVVVNTVKYYYDAEDKLTKKIITPASGSEQTIYYETTDDNTTIKFYAGGHYVTSHSKTDNFGRKTFDELQLGTDFVSRQFIYHVGKVTDEHKDNAKVKCSATTQLVSQIILSDGRTLSYEYDAEERITKVTDSVDGVTEYTYDALGQLLAEKVNGQVVNAMTYNGYGKILTRNGKTYFYDNSTWKDLLTSYNGQTITYDAQGNPTTYLGHTLTWEKGRQLKSFDGNTYTYNANGIRTSKTVGGIKHTYTLDGTKILREALGSNTIVPMYDNEDSVCGILYNNVPYYFIKNLQGDIIAIVDKDAKTVARYTYDAWGACTITQDTSGRNIATINPYRYREYYYDAEIRLYYLQSRYYDVGVGRFINSDDVRYLNVRRANVFKNLITYCNNNSVNCYDPNGYELFLIIGGVQLSVKALVLLAGCITAIIALVGQLLRDLPKITKAISQALEDLFDALTVAVEKAKTKVQQWKKANHHIIARMAPRAKPANLIWTKRLGLSINDSRNLVPINQNLHYFVHTKQYYDTVNTLVGLGYTKGRAGVLAVVKAIRTTFLVINEWCF